jgi:hypothetical protein
MKERALEEMRKAEEALEAQERERRLQAEKAKRLQQEKQNAFRRSLLLRQEVPRPSFFPLFFLLFLC